MPGKLKFAGEAKDMTLDEVEDAVKRARAAGVPGDVNVFAVISTSGKIKEMEVPLEPEF